MRFLHTADWHLGKLLHGASLLDDQKHILDRICEIAKGGGLDLILIAGDLYDRSVPPADAVALLDATLSRLRRDCGVPIVMIAGNHDSPERVSFGAQILAKGGVHVVGRLQDGLHPVEIPDADGAVGVFPLPYFEPVDAREVFGDLSLTSHELAMEAACTELKRHFLKSDTARHILVGHAFVAGGLESESERPLSIGGSGVVPASLFSSFNYTALGHLHRPQKVGGETVRYSGSPMKYSFSEHEHHKSVSIVEMNANGECAVETIDLVPRRDVRVMSGTLAELLAGDPSDDYLQAELADAGALLDPMGRLREVYPNILQIRRRFLEGEADAPSASGEVLNRSETDLFKNFFNQVAEESLSDEQAEAFAKVAEEQRDSERSA